MARERRQMQTVSRRRKWKVERRKKKVESKGKQQSPPSFTVLIAIKLSTLCRLVMNI